MVCIDAYFRLVKDAECLHRMREQLYVPNVVAHLGLLEDIPHETQYLRLMVHPSEDVSRLMPILLVVRAEERCSRHCVVISCLLIGHN